MALPVVFLDIRVGARLAGRLTFQLFSSTNPQTAENFRGLCTGEHGKSPVTGAALCFKGSMFYRIVRGALAEGGDITRHDGTGGESVFGSSFPDENYLHLHDAPGLLSLASSGHNASRFCVTFRPNPERDGKYVVFGRLVDGLEVLSQLENVPTDADAKPEVSVVIEDCGEITEDAEGMDAVAAAPAAPTADLPPEGPADGAHPLSDAIAATVLRSAPPTDAAELSLEEVEGPAPDTGAAAPSSSALAALGDPLQMRLMALQMKMNECRKANRQEVLAEHKREMNPKDKKRRVREWEEAKKAKAEELAKLGLTPEKAYMTEPAEVSAAKAERRKEKAKGKVRSFGWDVFNAETLFKAYKKRVAKLPTRPGDGAKSGIASEGAARVVAELDDRDKAHAKFSRRRAFYDEDTVDYVNERNRIFNRKLSRAFDKYTMETRQNLERGTAL